MILAIRERAESTNPLPFKEWILLGFNLQINMAFKLCMKRILRENNAILTLTGMCNIVGTRFVRGNESEHTNTNIQIPNYTKTSTHSHSTQLPALLPPIYIVEISHQFLHRLFSYRRNSFYFGFRLTNFVPSCHQNAFALSASQSNNHLASRYIPQPPNSPRWPKLTKKTDKLCFILPTNCVIISLFLSSSLYVISNHYFHPSQHAHFLSPTFSSETSQRNVNPFPNRFADLRNTQQTTKFVNLWNTPLLLLLLLTRTGPCHFASLWGSRVRYHETSATKPVHW